MMLSRVCGKNYVMTHFSTDDFGTMVQVVAKKIDPDKAICDLVVVSKDTWWHLFDWDQEIRAEAS